MTEFEINKSVAEKLGFQSEIRENGAWIFNKIWIPFDPCNEPLQAWDIMMKHNICVTQGDDELYDAVHNLEFYCQGEWHVDLCVTDKKPLVAAMLCFLEM